MKTNKGFIGLPVLVAIILGIVVLGAGTYFVIHQNPTSKTSTQVQLDMATDTQVQKLKNETTGQFEGLLRQETNNSWVLFVPLGKDGILYNLQFTSNSVCVIGSDEGRCSTLLSNYNSKEGNKYNTGGDGVRVDGNKQGNTITVNKLTLTGNFSMNGNLVETASESGQKMWSLVYQTPPSVNPVNITTSGPGQNSVDITSAPPAPRPTNTIPLKFDEKSFCGDTGQINCDMYALHQNDWVFVQGIKYKGVLLVRMLTIPQKAPNTLPH